MCFTELTAASSGPTPTGRSVMRADRHGLPADGIWPQMCLCEHARHRHAWSKSRGWGACREGMNFDTGRVACTCPYYAEDPVDSEVSKVLAFLAKGE